MGGQVEVLLGADLVAGTPISVSEILYSSFLFFLCGKLHVVQLHIKTGTFNFMQNTKEQTIYLNLYLCDTLMLNLVI
jgi:hypothetical protein